MALETIIDNLRDGYNQLEPSTFQHADQLTAAQVKDPSLRNQCFYTADGPLYSVEGKKKTPTLWLTREPYNLVLRHLNDNVNSSYEQFVKTGTFRPGLDEARRAMKAKSTLRIDLSKLRLQGDNSQWQYLEISTTKYAQLKAEERKLAERFYGKGKAFIDAMKMLHEAGIPATTVHVLSPAYVNNEAESGPVGRAAWRDNLRGSADSDATDLGVYDRDRLLGVRRERREEAPAGRGAEKGVVPSTPSVASVPPEVRALTMEAISGYTLPFLPQRLQEEYQEGLKKLY